MSHTMQNIFIMSESIQTMSEMRPCRSTFLLLPLCQNLNANPLEDDYLSHVSYMFSFLRVKWLKVSH